MRNKIRAGKRTLKEVYGSPLRGIVTGLNEAFVIDTPTRDRLCAQDPQSAELLKPFLEGKDLKRWRAEPRGLWLLLIPKGWTKSRYSVFNDDEAFQLFSQDYHVISGWLKPFEVQAKRRTDQGDFWWELRACVYCNQFLQSKVAYCHLQDKPIYSMETTGAYSNNKTYFIPTTDWSLLAILNSKTILFYFCSRTTAVRGGWREATTNTLRNCPYQRSQVLQRSIWYGWRKRRKEPLKTAFPYNDLYLVVFPISAPQTATPS